MPAPTKKLQATAYHESGHVIASFYLDIPFEYATIKPNENSLGHVHYNGMLGVLLQQRKNTGTDPTNDERILIENHIIIDFAGFFSEKKFAGRKNNIGSSSDWTSAVIKAEVVHSSISIIEKYLNYCAACSEEIVLNPIRWQQIEVIAENLLLRETLTYTDIQKIIADITLAHIS